MSAPAAYVPAAAAPWVRALHARVGTSGVVSAFPAQELRLASAADPVPAICDDVARFRVVRPMLAGVPPAAVSDLILRIVDANPGVAVWQLTLPSSDTALHSAAGVFCVFIPTLSLH